MKIIRNLTVAIGTLFSLFILIGLMPPGNMQVRRSVEIDVPPEQVFPLVNNLKKFNSWAPWSSQEHPLHFNYSGPDSGVGARMIWSDDEGDSQNGIQEIIQSNPPYQVTYPLLDCVRYLQHPTLDIS